MRLHPIGRSIVFSAGGDAGILLRGTIRGHSVVSGHHGKPANHTELFYIVELSNGGAWLEGQTAYVSLILVHPSNVEVS